MTPFRSVVASASRRRFSFNKLSAVIILAMSVGLLVPALIGLTMLSDFRQAEINRAIETSLKDKLDFLSHSLAGPIWNYDLGEARRIAEIALSDPQVVRISIVTPSKARLLDLQRPERGAGNSSVASNELTAGGKLLGTIELEFNDSYSRKAFEQDRKSFFAVLFGQFALAFVLVMIVLHFGILGPVARLTSFSRQLADGNLEQALGWKRNDELGQLGRHLDQMRRSVRVLLAEQDVILNNVPVGIAFVRDRTIQRANRRAELLFGYAPGEMSGKPTRAVYLDDSQYETVGHEAYLAITETRTGYAKELRLRRRDGTTFSALLRGSAIDPGAPQEGSIWVLDDITQRKQEEEALRREQQFSKLVIESLPGIFYLYTYPENRLVLWNKQHEILLGFTADEMANRHVLEWHVPEAKEAVLAAIDKVMTEGQNSIEAPLLAKDGTPVWFQMTGVKFEAEERSYFIGIGIDITARKKAEAELGQYQHHLEELVRQRTLELDTTNRQLMEAKDIAERANQAKSEFLSSMSHELRTPLNAIIGFAQMLEYDSGLNADQKDNVHEILKGGRHLLELINEVLDLARIEAGRVSLSLEPLDLSQLIAGCIELTQPLAAARNITMHIDIPPGIAVRGDMIRTKQALLNLLSNAVKYNRPGGSIRLAVEDTADQRRRIKVSDTGTGIAKEHQHELFQPFSRLKAEHSEIEGTGIGLTITRNLVEMMGGAVGVESEVNVGSTFWIELPGDTRLTDATDEHAATLRPATSMNRKDALSILCIDDNPVNLKLVAQMLSLRPHLRLITAHAPGLGIELAQTQHPDLILLDINMPHMNGYQVLEILRADPRTATMPIVAITANAMPQDIERGHKAGFTDYLTKPLNLDLFLNTIDRCLCSAREAS